MSDESNPNPGQGEQKPAGSDRQIPHEGHDTQHAPAQKPIATGVAVTGLVIVLLVFAAFATFGILSRIHHNNVLAKTTQESAAAPTVIALPPKPGAPGRHVCAARQCHRLHGFADLRADLGLPDEVVLTILART